MALNCTEPGDQIYLLIGSHVLFVLRPVGEKVELIVACYVHGIIYGEGLHPDSGFDNQLYPGSTPGGRWSFSDSKVQLATWTRVSENCDCLNGDGSIFEGFAAVELDDTGKRSKNRDQRFLLYEEERNPMMIETEKIIFKQTHVALIDTER